eukprot:1155486-Pelagomonas_calceolata.AAC.3
MEFTSCSAPASKEAGKQQTRSAVLAGNQAISSTKEGAKCKEAQLFFGETNKEAQIGTYSSMTGKR